MKEVDVMFAEQSLKDAFNLLAEGKFEDKQVYQSLVRAIDELKKNPSCGTQIPKKLIPKDYIKKYGVDNLWKYDLPNAWRLIYTLAATEFKIISIILEWLDHKNYERRFNYG